MNGVIGSTLFGAGIGLVLYSILPSMAWIGLFLAIMGSAVLFETQKTRFIRNGLKFYIPTWVNQYLTRHDLVEHLVRRIRENSAIQKVIRLVLIKVVDLSRDEIVEVLAGIWPGFRELSNHDSSLIDYTPDWFRNAYGGAAGKRMQLPLGNSHSQPALPNSDSHDAEENVDNLSPSSVATRHVIDDALSSPQRYDLYPLLMWIAEKRVRRGLSSTGPILGKFFTRTLLPAIVTILVWRKFPQSRRPLSRFFMLILFVYVVSVTRGLPAPFARIFNVLNLSYRRKNQVRRTTPTTGSIGSVIYAMIEPLIPVINMPPMIDFVHKVPPHHVSPSSPAPSQASTMEPHAASALAAANF